MVFFKTKKVLLKERKNLVFPRFLLLKDKKKLNYKITKIEELRNEKWLLLRKLNVDLL